MKTEQSEVQGNIVWVNNIELAHQEESLPILGNQLTAILSNLTPSNRLSSQVNISQDTFLVQTSDIVLPETDNNFIILKDNSSDQKSSIKKDDIKNEEQENFADMLYFVCNLCPFLCTKDTKITEHLAVNHKNKTEKKLPQLKCPACANIFYHKVSLRSHLIHDHGVGHSDLAKIVQAVVYYSNENSKRENEVKAVKSKGVIYCRNESELKKNTLQEELVMEKQIERSIENDDSITLQSFESDTMLETDIGQVNTLPKNDNEIIILPQCDISANSARRIFNTMIDQNTAKNQERKSIRHRCVVSHCKVHFLDINKMQYHLKCHQSDHGNFKCPECSEIFSGWKPLSSHLWRIHKIDMELFSCDKCDYKTYSLGKLNGIHKLIHGDVKAYSCSICDKAFKNSKQLRNHSVTHKKNDREVMECELCSKHFSDKRQLNIHMDVVHMKIKPYLCSFCGYKGSSRSSLRMHTRQHTGEKPFSCEICTYTTSDHNSLRRHKLRHSGQKPYKCAYCSYACIQSSTYKVHLKTKHPGLEKNLMFTCEYCQFRSVNKEIYTAHVLMHHKADK